MELLYASKAYRICTGSRSNVDICLADVALSTATVKFPDYGNLMKVPSPSGMHAVQSHQWPHISQDDTLHRYSRCAWSQGMTRAHAFSIISSVTSRKVGAEAATCGDSEQDKGSRIKAATASAEQGICEKRIRTLARGLR